MEFKLRFPETEIVKYAKSYSYTRNIQDVLKNIDPIQSKLFLKKQDLIYLAGWKAPRIGVCKFSCVTGFLTHGKIYPHILPKVYL